MGKYILLATGSMREGMKAEYDKWSDDVHLPDICSVPDVKSGRRFAVHPATPADRTNLSIYEIETDDPVAVLAEIGGRVQSGQLVLPPALDTDASGGMTLYGAC